MVDLHHRFQLVLRIYPPPHGKAVSFQSCRSPVAGAIAQGGSQPASQCGSREVSGGRQWMEEVQQPGDLEPKKKPGGDGSHVTW